MLCLLKNLSDDKPSFYYFLNKKGALSEEIIADKSMIFYDVALSIPD